MDPLISAYERFQHNLKIDSVYTARRRSNTIMFSILIA